MDEGKFLEFYKPHRGAINGAIIGFVLSILVLLIGIFKVMFIIISVVLGYFLGDRLSKDKKYITNFLDRILPPGTYR